MMLHNVSVSKYCRKAGDMQTEMFFNPIQFVAKMFFMVYYKKIKQMVEILKRMVVVNGEGRGHPIKVATTVTFFHL